MKKQQSISGFFKRPQQGRDVVIEENQPSKRPKYNRDNNRSVKAVWFSDFQWLIHDTDKNSFFCELCKSCKKSNIFTTVGKDGSKPKRDDFVKHARSEDHRAAVKAQAMKKDMTTATTNAFSGCKDTMKAQMATVLFQAQEAIPTRKNLPLLSLQIFNVSEFIQNV